MRWLLWDRDVGVPNAFQIPRKTGQSDFQDRQMKLGVDPIDPADPVILPILQRQSTTKNQ
jgi:hypothetical protein